MTEPSPQQAARLARYHGQSVRLLRDAMHEARQSRWLRCEELLWGSVTLAVKGVALTRGDEVDDRQAVEQYAQSLGREHNDRRIRDAFARLNGFADAADRVRESRGGAQQLVAILEDVTSAVERLWDFLPAPAEPEPQAEPAPPSQATGRPPSNRRNRRRRGRGRNGTRYDPEEGRLDDEND